MVNAIGHITLKFDIKTFNNLKAIKRKVAYRLNENQTWEEFIKYTITRIK
jgi:hypothetical protein